MQSAKQKKYKRLIGHKIKYNIFLFVKLTINSLNNYHTDYIMQRPDYPLFSKRYTREKRGAYNFEKTKEYDLAEQWFKDRKGAQKELIPVSSPPVKPTPIQPIGPPPGLEKKVAPEPIRVQREDYELDLKIPSYDEFDYVDPDDFIYNPLPSFNLNMNTNILFEQEYSTPLITEGEIYTNNDYEDDTYIGQLAEFDAQEAITLSNNIQEMYNHIMMYQMMALMYSTIYY